MENWSKITKNTDWEIFEKFLINNNINHREIDSQYWSNNNFYIIVKFPIRLSANLGYNLQEVNLCCELAFDIRNKDIQEISILNIGTFKIDEIEISKHDIIFKKNNKKIISFELNI